MSELRPCALIPVYNHPDTVAGVVERLARHELPIILVDDGCDAGCRRELERLASLGHTLVTHADNRGKGAAVRSGLIEAERLGYTHALQVDADGQHHPADIPAFLDAMYQSPRRLLAGYACYDESVPKARRYGRYATHVWVWINTLSRHIRDSMCGVRLYPVTQVNSLLRRHPCGNRMTFDTEVLVRWYWAGGELANLPVRVHYPEQGVSHFAVWRDNTQISLMHARLFLAMWPRLPRLLRRHWRQP
ncbi:MULTISPECIES: glycosyltransferase family 2 protein [Halomonas]|uniref:glycosyltransferase family 2 protein n=1 Tax=Halomonas TaxID=2745 RepID=UPI001A8D91FC|nr:MULTISPECIES: glycosyltransferase family 2 protein [Halomonas]MBN8413928.1 glycosyltransferase family 2 protein [Halomonas litopenaei]MBY5926870.1 glycosyltransferase family 2 protein [Halomonas sp. DP4Y7-2]MBY6233912.1 glycosyltransferase family 2 protein [Halomonas sp. DP4Y7-1]MED5294235.1 glycosyltransferase family 2 protein [Pseudomonadota bacterium]